MRFLIFASLWARWSFISAVPTDDLFALGLDEPVSNLNLQSSGDDSDSWDLGFNSGLDQNSNYPADDSIFGSTDLAFTADTSTANTNAFTSSDDLFGLDDPANLIALQGSCAGTDSSVPSDMLTARDTDTCSSAPEGNQNQWEVPSLFTDPEGALGEQKPTTPNEQKPKPEQKPDEPTIRGLLWGDLTRWFRGLGGDGVDCPADHPIRCCTDVAGEGRPLGSYFIVNMMSCAPSKLSVFSSFLLLAPNTSRTAPREAGVLHMLFALLGNGYD